MKMQIQTAATWCQQAVKQVIYIHCLPRRLIHGCILGARPSDTGTCLTTSLYKRCEKKLLYRSSGCPCACADWVVWIVFFVSFFSKQILRWLNSFPLRKPLVELHVRLLGPVNQLERRVNYKPVYCPCSPYACSSKLCSALYKCS